MKTARREGFTTSQYEDGRKRKAHVQRQTRGLKV